MTSYAATDCAAEQGTEQWGYSRETGKIEASVTLRCAATDVGDLVDDLIADAECPFVPGSNKPIAVSVSVTGEAPDGTITGQMNDYEDALVKVKYGFLDYEDTTQVGVKVIERLTPNTKVKELDYRNFRWAAADGDPLRPSEAPGRIETDLMFTRKLVGLTTPFHVDTIGLIGYVNLNAYVSDSLGLTFAAETLLYLDPDFGREQDVDGESATYTQTWAINRNGWNKIWREETQSFQSMYNVTGGLYKTYPTDAMTNILF